VEGGPLKEGLEKLLQPGKFEQRLSSKWIIPRFQGVIIVRFVFDRRNSCCFFKE
jgi:hypothetical protein